MDEENVKSVSIDSEEGRAIDSIIRQVMSLLTAAPISSRGVFSSTLYIMVIVAKKLGTDLDHLVECIKDAWDSVEVSDGDHPCIECGNCGKNAGNAKPPTGGNLPN